LYARTVLHTHTCTSQQLAPKKQRAPRSNRNNERLTENAQARPPSENAGENKKIKNGKTNMEVKTTKSVEKILLTMGLGSAVPGLTRKALNSPTPRYPETAMAVSPERSRTLPPALAREAFEEQARTAEAGFGLLELGDIERGDAIIERADAPARAGKGCRQNNRAAERQGVRGVRF